MKKINKTKFMTSLKENRKKIIVSVCLVALLAATVVLNYALTDKTDAGIYQQGGEQETMSFFESYRIDREETRAQQILMLEEVIATTTEEDTAKNEAQEKKLSIVDNMDKELSLESLIKAKGFNDCVVTISSSNVNVIVMSEQLEVADTANILTVVVEETQRPVSDIIIIPYV